MRGGSAGLSHVGYTTTPKSPKPTAPRRLLRLRHSAPSLLLLQATDVSEPREKALSPSPCLWLDWHKDGPSQRGR